MTSRHRRSGTLLKPLGAGARRLSALKCVWLGLAALSITGCTHPDAPPPPAATEAQESRPVLCYAGPSMKRSMEELARTYEEKTGKHVTVESNDPRSLIDKIVLAPAAGLFVSHDPFLSMLRRQGVGVRQSWCVASLTPTLAVLKGNPKQIHALADLAKPGIRVGMTDAQSTISSHIVAVMLEKSGLTEAVNANVVLHVPAGRYLVSALADDKIDAGFVWNAVVYGNRDKIEAVDVPTKWRPERGVDSIFDSPTLGKLELDYVRVTLAELASCPTPQAAHAFAEFVASPAGMAVFAKNGFSPADPDRPVLLPESAQPAAAKDASD